MLATYRKLMDLLDARERGRFHLLMGMVLLMGFFNMLGVASLLPFLALLAQPDPASVHPLLGRLSDWTGLENPQTFLTVVGAAGVAVYLFGVAFKALTSYALIRFSAMRGYSLSRRMLENYIAQSYSWSLGRHTADMVKTVLGETSQVISGALIPFCNLISGAVLTAFLLVLLVFVEPTVAIVMGGLIGVIYIGLFLGVRHWLTRLGKIRLAANQARFRAVQDALRGFKTIKILGLERNAATRFRGPAETMARATSVAGLLGDLPRHLMEVIALGGMVTVVIWLIGIKGGDLSQVLPVAGVYALAGARIAPAMQQVYSSLNQLRFTRPVLDTLHADFQNAAPPPPPPPPALPLRDRLALRRVRYAYPDSERGALEGLDLEVAVNTSVGLVGGTGAGKTTAVDVIMGLLEPQAGALEIDGRALRTELDRRAWRRSIGYVPQQIFLIDASMAENIAFGDRPEDIDMAAVERAARMAELHDFVIGELPSGYDTHLGDAGMRLSGGQRQRVGIARALYRDPDVLVLDEATSALDNITERAVMEAVSKLGGKKTVIMIAHRLTTVMGCDEIFLLEHGRAVARGNYAQLVETNPIFRKMAGGEAA